ncbi:MAG: PilZ domain-containing protein [Polyangiaceae bacterium]
MLQNHERRHGGARLSSDLAMTSYRDGYAKACRAVDLSASGALVRRISSHRPPMVQRLELHLGRDEPLEVLARTVWSNDDLHAVRFIGLSDVDRLDIAEYLDALERRRRRAGDPAAHWWRADDPRH